MNCRCGAPLPNNHTALCASCMPSKPKQSTSGTYLPNQSDGLKYIRMHRSPTASLVALTAAEARMLFFHQKVFEDAQQIARQGEVACLPTPLSVIIIAPEGTADEEMRRAGDGAIASARQGKG